MKTRGFSGRTHSKETRDRMSLSRSGEKHPLYGKCHTEETKRKMRLACIGRPSSFLGKHHSDESKKKLSLSHIGMTGEKSGRWKGGMTSIRSKIYHTIQNEQWRQKVFSRDDFTCRECGKRGGELEAHHLKPFVKLLQEARSCMPLYSPYDAAMLYTPMWDIANGQTLCKKCHDKTKRKRKG